MTSVSDKGFTIAEAAQGLNVPKKTLRHVLARPDRKARLLREYRNTKKGLVTVEIVPPDLYQELEGGSPAEVVANEAPPVSGDAGAPQDAKSPAAAVSVTLAEPVALAAARHADTALIVATYERLLSEKEGRLMDLRAALEAERENNRRLSEALAREQSAHAAASQQRTAQEASSNPDPPRRSWLDRLLQR